MILTIFSFIRNHGKFLFPTILCFVILIYIGILKMQVLKYEKDNALLRNINEQLAKENDDSNSNLEVLQELLDKQSIEIKTLSDANKKAQIAFKEWLIKEDKYKEKIKDILSNKDNTCDGIRNKIKEMGKLKYEDL